MKGKPFALIGVNINCHDPKTLKAVMDAERLGFRSFTDTKNGEGLGVIGSAWNLYGTPMVFVLDHKGVIRYRRVGYQDTTAIDELLNKLMTEADENHKKEK